MMQWEHHSNLAMHHASDSCWVYEHLCADAHWEFLFLHLRMNHSRASISRWIMSWTSWTTLLRLSWFSRKMKREIVPRAHCRLCFFKLYNIVCAIYRSARRLIKKESRKRIHFSLEWKYIMGCWCVCVCGYWFSQRRTLCARETRSRLDIIIMLSMPSRRTMICSQFAYGNLRIIWKLLILDSIRKKISSLLTIGYKLYFYYHIYKHHDH